jgi:hypothetical protein
LSDYQRNRPSFGASHGSVLCHRRFAVTENPWFGFFNAFTHLTAATVAYQINPLPPKPITASIP